jgi:hypothetical protein
MKCQKLAKEFELMKNHDVTLIFIENLISEFVDTEKYIQYLVLIDIEEESIHRP